jgi:hypothetical protein
MNDGRAAVVRRCGDGSVSIREHRLRDGAISRAECGGRAAPCPMLMRGKGTPKLLAFGEIEYLCDTYSNF